MENCAKIATQRRNTDEGADGKSHFCKQLLDFTFCCIFTQCTHHVHLRPQVCLYCFCH